MDSSSFFSSAPSSSSPNWKYDVFLSFHEEDVRRSFLSDIMEELVRKGIKPFSGNATKRGVSIAPEIIEAIRGSRIAMVILSSNYASSSWCLGELAEIMNCREELGQVVMPIFHQLEPFVDVRKQTGKFGKMFRETCKGKTKEEIRRWSQDLTFLSSIPGYHSRIWDSNVAVIEKLVCDIFKVINYPMPSSEFEGLVGMQAHLEKMESVLCMELDEVRMIGIWGPPGIGKTTIARSLFTKHSHQFHLGVFMDNFEHSHPGTRHNEYNKTLRLQTQFLTQLLNQRHTDEYLYMGVAQKWLKDKKVLVVLDNVDSLAQFDALAKARWFGPGSRIIITTQELTLLKARGINHVYKVDFPSPDEALQILCMHAFGQKTAEDGFVKLAREATRLSCKFPLGLMRTGSYLRGMTKEKWEFELPSLRTRFSYNCYSRENDISHHHILCLRDVELNEAMEEDTAKGFSETRQELITTNQDLKEDVSTSERTCQGISVGSPPAVHVYFPSTLQFSFASHLTMDFRRKGISVTCNGELDVMEGASAYVVIFSNNCLSPSSLDTLLRVAKWLMRNDKLVVPVFYGTSPSDLLMQEHETADWIKEWGPLIQDLEELDHYREECNDCELVEEIVEHVYRKLFPTEQIGINSRLLEIEKLLCKQPWGIRRIGIWGMPGIGKTTLAQALFDKISGVYEALCFIERFDEEFHEKGIYRLLEEKFGTFLKELPRVSSSITRPNLPWDTLSKKRVLVVLDDVQNPLVAESFLRGFHWFGPGSLIIITSRDKQVFRLCQIDHVYEVQSLDQNESLHLFSQYAFGNNNIREKNLRKLSMEVIDYADGNPLALSLYGRELEGKKPSEMEATFLKLKLPSRIHDLFNSSYETLDDNEKKILLDIACFFNGEKVAYVMQLLEGCGFFPHVGIDVLLDKCLLKISEKRVKMHRIIQDFGREIINGETEKIERRRRLWEPSTIKFLLEDNTEANRDSRATDTSDLGSEDIEGIFLDTSNMLFDVNPAAFENMHNLRFLKIYSSSYENLYGLGLPKGLQSLPNELRLLHWENYPLESLPQDFEPDHLVELNLSYSQLRELWGGSKNLHKLKMVRLCHSQQLTEIDDIIKAQNIELVDLGGSKKLQSFPATGQLQHLRVINLSYCREIKSFPEISKNVEELDLRETGIGELLISTGNVINLKKLYISGCTSLLELPASIGDGAINLEILDLGECSSLKKLPSSIGNATNLKKLRLTGCSSLVEIPSSIGKATSLQELNLECCSSLVGLPSSFGNAKSLKELYLTGCSRLVRLPSSIGNLTNLKVLDLINCSSLRKLPSSIGNATNLEILNIEYCSSLVELPSSLIKATKLEKLCLVGCFSLVDIPSFLRIL